MKIYMRNKSVGVQRQGADLRVVTGVLEDELYAMDCRVAIYWPDLKITAIEARMKRFTTVRCPLAADVFSRAVGWTLGPDLDGKIKKELGRFGCRHMAQLLVDCCRAAAREELACDLRAAQESDDQVDVPAFVAAFLRRRPQLADYFRLS
jgi:hypothetical protein